MLQRYIDIFDLHFGWERTLERGEWVARPTHNIRAVNSMMRFALDFEPHIVLLGGDQLNATSVSHWNSNKPLLIEGLRLREEIELLDKYIIRPFDGIIPKKNGRKIWMDGNHEAWIDQFVSEHAGVEGLLEPRKILNLRQRGWEIFSQGEMAWIGKLAYLHGDAFFKNFRGAGPKAPAEKLVNAYHRNIRCGHLHTYAVATQVTPSDASDFHTGIVRPAMCMSNLAYAQGTPNNTMTGFGYGWVDSDTGLFSDYTVIMQNDSFVANGRMYV